MIGLPTLSSAAYLQDPGQILDRQMSYFFVADYSQSNVHRGSVSSLPYIIKTYSHDKSQLITQTELAINRMLSGFDSVNITVSVEDSTTNANEYNMILEGYVIADKRQYGIAKLLTVNHNKLAKVSELDVR